MASREQSKAAVLRPLERRAGVLLRGTVRLLERRCRPRGVHVHDHDDGQLTANTVATQPNARFTQNRKRTRHLALSTIRTSSCSSTAVQRRGPGVVPGHTGDEQGWLQWQ